LHQKHPGIKIQLKNQRIGENYLRQCYACALAFKAWQMAKSSATAGCLIRRANQSGTDTEAGSNPVKPATTLQRTEEFTDEQILE